MGVEVGRASCESMLQGTSDDTIFAFGSHPFIRLLHPVPARLSDRNDERRKA